MNQFEEIKDMLNESTNDIKAMSKIKDFLMKARQNLRNNKIDELKKISPELKSIAKKFNAKKLVQQSGIDKSKLLKMQDEYEKNITPNKYFSFILAYTTIMKSKLTNTSIDSIKRKNITQYNKNRRSGKGPVIAATILVITTLWTSLYFSSKTINSQLNLPDKLTEKLPKNLKNGNIQIPIFIMLVAAFIIGIYVKSENATPPSDNAQIKTSSNQPKPNKSKNNNDNNNDFVL